MSDEVSPEYVAAAHAELSEDQRESLLQSLGTVLVGEFAKAVLMRNDTEQRWLSDLRQYRGIYDAATLAKLANRSKTFVRKTRVKVKTIDSRVADLLFPAGSEKNWSIGPTPKPMIGDDQKAEIIQKMKEAAGQKIQMQQAAMAQGQKPVAGGPGQPDVMPNGEPVVQGMPDDPTEDQITDLVNEFVKQAAKKMEIAIDDQLSESRYKEVCIKTIHSGHLYGVGVMKGPLLERKTRTRFTKVTSQGVDGRPVMKWEPKSEYFVVPYVENVPLWRFYPDMTATELEDCQYVYERHFMPRNRMVELSKNKSFKKPLILAHLRSNPHGSRSSTTSQTDSELRSIGDRQSDSSSINNGTYEVIERWGWLTGHQLREAGLTVAEDRLEEAFFSNVWMLHTGVVIKVALPPIDGTTWPYHLYHFDKDETSIFGEGLASVMRDDQTMLNAATRVMLDNAALTSGPQLEINMALLAKSEKAEEIHPFKIWKRNGQQPGVPAIRPIDIPNHLEDLVRMAAMFEQNTDEVTAIPRYMSGDNPTSGAAGTASGMSMLMAAANIVIKDLVTAWDEGVTRPFLQALYHWNMKYNPDDSIKGDYDVKARGTASLVAKEVRARSLMEFSASVANPLDAPYIKRHKLLLQRAEAQELSDAVYSEDEFEAQQESPEAKAMKGMQEQMQKLQLAELQAKIDLQTANAKLADRKVEELGASMTRMMKETELTVAKTLETTVAAIYAALQAGGAATGNPFAAPAADEILKSAGFKDLTPNPSIAELDTRPVQATDGTHQLLNKGQSFAVQPRAGDQIQQPPNSTNLAPQVDQPNTAPPQGAGPAPDLHAQTGEVGLHHGIETERMEPA